MSKTHTVNFFVIKVTEVVQSFNFCLNHWISITITDEDILEKIKQNFNHLCDFW